MQTSELRDMLRDGAAALPSPAPDGRLQVAKRVRKRRTRRRCGLAAAVAVVVAASAAGVSALPHTHRQMVSVSPAASTPIVVVPAGTRQILQPASPLDLSTFGAAASSNRSSSVLVIPGTYHTFTVQGSPAFAVADVTPATGPSGASHGWKAASALFYVGVGGASGTGNDSAFMPLDSVGDATHPPVAIIADWPAPGQQLYVWTHLPSGTAYVTYSCQDADLTWQSTVDGTIAMLVPRPAAFEGDYATWHSAPLPVMQAYDDAGHLLTETKAPRIGGDDLKVGS